MALRVWLPLIRDINNQGLSNLTFKNVNTANTTNVAGGKLGKCYQNNSNTAGGLVSNETISLGQNQSMFCWVKMNSFYSTANLTGIGGQHRYSSNRGMGITMRYVSATTGYLSVNTGNGSSRTYNEYYGKTLLNAGTWYHVGYTYDGSTIRLYVNGKLDKEQAYSGMSVPADYICIFAWSLNSTSGNAIHANYQLNGMINDFRIYDHTLSQKEISELAKGLICHYRLDNHGCGCPNLLSASNGEFSGTVPSSSYTDFKSFGSISVNANEYLTVSFDAKSSKDGVNLTNYLYNNNGSTYVQVVESVGSQDLHTTTGSDGAYGIILSTGYKRYWIRRKFSNATASTKTLLFRIIYSNNTSYAGATVTIRNIKLEKSSVATPFYTNSIPNSTVESDCSGNGYNGTITGSVNVSSDTTRYMCCYIWESGQQKYIKFPVIDFTGITNSYTIAFFARCSDVTNRMPFGFGDGNRLNLFTTNGIYCLNTGDSAQNPFKNGSTNVSCSSHNDNKWRHYAIVGNGTTTILYIDGVRTGQAKTYKSITGTQLYISGWSTDANFKWVGGINDFRLYGTALSDADVLELAKTSASIDNTGKVYCYNYIEE